MNTQAQTVAEHCSQGSDDNTLIFPEVLGQMAEAGIEGYYSDLRRATKIFYMPNGDTIEVITDKVSVLVSESFDATGVEAAVLEIQKGRLTYKEFCKKVMAAGCASYIVSLPGQRVVYFGRTGEAHIEYFPSAK